MNLIIFFYEENTKIYKQFIIIIQILKYKNLHTQLFHRTVNNTSNQYSIERINKQVILETEIKKIIPRKSLKKEELILMLESAYGRVLFRIIVRSFYLIIFFSSSINSNQ